jgi:membrane fusion protein (multidrug efflux system)
MYADASIALDERKDALAVPVQALNRHGAQATVLRVGDGNRIDEQRVTLGLETSDRIEVLSGLKEGDLVVVGGQGQLRPGQKVEPKIVDLTPVREES